jgi:ferritin-like protein
MDLQNYIRSKVLPEELHFKLLNIVSKDTIAKDLIDVIIENAIDTAEQNKHISNLNEKIQDLEITRPQRIF